MANPNLTPAGPRDYLKSRLRETTNALRAAAELLPEHVRDSARQPMQLAVAAQYESAKLLLKNSLAFGQHPGPVPSLEAAQIGLYGTSAALELLAASENGTRLLSDKDNFSISSVGKAWCGDICRTTLFLYSGIEILPELGHRVFESQANGTLRLAHALRALVEVRPLFVRLGDAKFRNSMALPDELQMSISELCQNDWPKFIDDMIGAVTSRLCSITKNCGDPATSSKSYCKQRSESTRVYAYTSLADDLPQSLNQWVFLTASVAVAIRRAAGRSLISKETSLNILTADTISALVDACEYNESLDPRLQIFAMWSLSEADGPSCPEQLKTCQHGKRLGELIGNLALRLVRSTTGLTDVHLPYYVNQKTTKGPIEQRGDYCVVPTVPTLLIAISQLRPQLLAERDVFGLILRLKSSVQAPERWREPIPFQVGEQDGTINLLYYYRAIISVSHALEFDVRRPLLTAVWFGFRRYWIEIALSVTAATLLIAGFKELGLGMTAWVLPKLLENLYSWASNRRRIDKPQLTKAQD